MGRSVREMLETVSSEELAELRAYEYINGPIGPQYVQETMAALHEQLQRIVSTLIAVNTKDEDDIPDVMTYPRPYEIYKHDGE